MSVTVLPESTTPGAHKVKIAGVIISEEGGQGGVKNSAAIQQVRARAHAHTAVQCSQGQNCWNIISEAGGQSGMKTFSAVQQLRMRAHTEIRATYDALAFSTDRCHLPCHPTFTSQVHSRAWATAAPDAPAAPPPAPPPSHDQVVEVAYKNGAPRGIFYILYNASLPLIDKSSARIMSLPLPSLTCLQGHGRAPH